MTNAAATPDPIAAATAIITNARRSFEDTKAAGNDPARGGAAVVALGAGVIISLVAIAAMVTSPATIPLWCAAHGGCP